MQCITNELHDRANCSLDVDPVISKDGDQACRAADGRELNKCGIIIHDHLEVLGAIRDHPI